MLYNYVETESYLKATRPLYIIYKRAKRKTVSKRRKCMCRILPLKIGAIPHEVRGPLLVYWPTDISNSNMGIPRKTRLILYGMRNPAGTQGGAWRFTRAAGEGVGVRNV